MAVVTTRGLEDSASLRLAQGKMLRIFFLPLRPKGARTALLLYLLTGAVHLLDLLFRRLTKVLKRSCALAPIRMGPMCESSPTVPNAFFEDEESCAPPRGTSPFPDPFDVRIPATPQKQKMNKHSCSFFVFAESRGFEPRMAVTPYSLSRRAH